MLAGLALAALAALAAPLSAQTVGGLVRDRRTGMPVAETSVALRGAGAADTIVARAKTDSIGAFYLPAPGPGSYRVAFAFGARQVVLSEPVSVEDSTSFDQREYVVDVPTDVVYFEFQVDKPAAPTTNLAPAYPARLQEAGIGGSFAVEFVVDTLGHVVLDSFATLQPADPLFVEAVRRVLPRMRFLPAERRGRKVRQLVHQTFAFSPGDDD